MDVLSFQIVSEEFRLISRSNYEYRAGAYIQEDLCYIGCVRAGLHDYASGRLTLGRHKVSRPKLQILFITLPNRPILSSKTYCSDRYKANLDYKRLNEVPYLCCCGADWRSG